MQTTPPKLPKGDLTPPVPQPGAPMIVLTPPPNPTSTPLGVPGENANGATPAAGANPSPTPTIG